MLRSMFEQRRWPREAWIPMTAGLGWLWAATGGAVLFAVGLLPGLLLLGGGVSTLLWPGDRRISAFTAMGAVLGTLLALLSWPWQGLGFGLLVLLTSAGSFLAAGFASIRQAAHVDGVPQPELSMRLAAEVGLDEAVLGTLQLSLDFPRGDDAARINREVHAGLEIFAAQGWLEKPRDFHPQPPPLLNPSLESKQWRGIDYERLSFASEYEPHALEPGRDRYLGYAQNRTAEAWVLRHAGEPRPWLVCLHGFRMGTPGIDLRAFDPRLLHRELGMNLLVPVLPLHGSRKVGKRSGDRFMDGDPFDTIHAEAQAMWDIRRMLQWIRAAGEPKVGVYGLSLGGYTAALLASIEIGLACAILGVPLSDMARIFWQHGPRLDLRSLEAMGLHVGDVARMFKVVAPLDVEPRVVLEGRAIFAGVADRIVPAALVRDLYEHWERPRSVWYQGAHLTFGRDPRVAALVRETIESRLSAGPPVHS